MKNSTLLGWEGKVASFTNITGKVPILLTSIVHVVDGSGSKIKIHYHETNDEREGMSVTNYKRLLPAHFIRCKTAYHQLKLLWKTITRGNFEGAVE